MADGSGTSQPPTGVPGAGMLVVISGPSGVGKTTLARLVVERIDGATLSVSATTRAKTEHDTEGVDYYFLSEDEFRRRVEAGAFLEHAQYADRRYGTLREPVERAMREGRIVILEIDVEGAVQVRRQTPGMLGVFVLPPDEDVLLRRLRERKRESEDAIRRRFELARGEIARAKTCGAYDAFVVNETLDQAAGEIVAIIERERSGRRARNAAM